MGVGVYTPKRQQSTDSTGQMLQLGGLAAGALIGKSPQAAMTGMSLGGAVGGMMGPQAQVEGPGAVQTGGSDALQRRMQKIQENPQMQIANSIDSLKFIQDPQMRADLAKPLLQADYMARNKGQV